ncbi:MAG: hypothetical protein KAH31_06520 [Candidatus Sabulitectum sp.]|nr:hypothetical protein [Candidatus Sabulitectum sp.]
MSFLILLLIAGVYDETPITRNLDPDFVPGTYAEYRSGQPEFTELIVTPVTGEIRGTEFLVVMEENMSDSLDSALLDQWLADIQSEGNSSAAVEITYANPIQIRAWLLGLYNDGLEGVVFVGDIPVPWSCTVDRGAKSNETFPSDYFYMDLDGTWEDNWIGYPGIGTAGQDSIYDGWSGELFPEIYTGRITTSVLILGNEYDLINDYLARLHEWRLVGDPEPRALCYVDDDWAGWGNSYRSAMENLYDDVELVNLPHSATNGTDYRENRLQEGYTWISPFVHSGPTSHAWSPGPSTTAGHIWTDNPPSRFFNLFACSNARFTSNWCMGCAYVFGTDYGLAAVGSTKSGAMLQFAQFYTPLGEGENFGSGYKAWWTHIISGGFSQSEQYWHLGMVVIGDPTIMPAMHMLGIEDGTPSAAPAIHFSANPAMGAVTIVSQGVFTIHDMTGREVANGYQSETFTGLQTGVYLVRAENNGFAVVEKLCVIR